MRALQFLAFAVALDATVFAASGAGQTTFATLHRFGLSPGDGISPNGVVAGPNGVLYGTTIAGGAYYGGTVFELDPPARAGAPWTETILYSFNGISGDGYYPTAVPAIGAHGELYSTTEYGGTYGSGTVFALEPPAIPTAGWTEKVLYSFTGQSDGANPAFSTLVIGPQGAIYGTTQGGGTAYSGTVFKLQPPATPGAPWTERVLHNFGYGTDGGDPETLIAGANGALYGTALFGGDLHAGMVFELTPPPDSAPDGQWTETVVHSFTGGADGCYPSSVALAADGALYGAAFGTILLGNYPGIEGDGMVFQLTPPAQPGGSWTKTVLRDFGNEARGPDALVVRSGAIYITNGVYETGGVVALQPPPKPGEPWTKTDLHFFPSNVTATGNFVVDQNGTLYGATYNWTGYNDDGVVYLVKP